MQKAPSCIISITEKWCIITDHNRFVSRNPYSPSVRAGESARRSSSVACSRSGSDSEYCTVRRAAGGASGWAAAIRVAGSARVSAMSALSSSASCISPGCYQSIWKRFF